MCPIKRTQSRVYFFNLGSHCTNESLEHAYIAAGIVALLNEETQLAKATAHTMVAKFNNLLGQHPRYSQCDQNDAFSVLHYAGAVR